MPGTYVRGAEIFGEGNEAEHFREKLRVVRDRDGWTIFAWCLTSNHYHLVLGTGQVSLAPWVAHLQSHFGVELRREDDGFRADFDRLDQELVLTAHEDFLEA